MRIGLRYITVIVSLLLASGAGASSFGVQWNNYISPQGSLLTAQSVSSFLGDETVHRVQIFAVKCSPQSPKPYVTVLASNRNDPNQQMPGAADFQINLGNGAQENYYGTFDKIASVNAGDQRPRYSFEVETTSRLFAALMQSGNRIYPRIQMNHSARSNGVQLQIIRESERQKVRDFLNSCNGFIAQQASTGQQAVQVNYCKNYLNGPSPYTKTTTVYDDTIADQVCGPVTRDVQPAICMHFAMSGGLAYDQQGNSLWAPANAAQLCKQSTNASARIDCFRSHVAAGALWQVAIPLCNQTN